MPSHRQLAVRTIAQSHNVLCSYKQENIINYQSDFQDVFLSLKSKILESIYGILLFVYKRRLRNIYTSKIYMYTYIHTDIYRHTCMHTHTEG